MQDVADFAVGQTWSGASDTRRIEVMTSNARGERVVGYLGESGTALATEFEFRSWVQDEAAERG